uniref:NADH-ubiquinone oxidoreductase chain 3 n=1 Tax=Quadrula quadrula TaxID=52372 RepID=D2DVZ3_QUAQU|nr:NADH dehydrogenase subunit 3 [Quadrula quadrula]
MYNGMGVLVAVFCSVVFSFIVVGFGLVLSYRSSCVYSLSSPFECGFDPLGSSRVGFSLRFFLFMVFFVVFDFETVLLVPSVIWFGSGLVGPSGVFGFVGFLVILFVGVLYEMKEGALEWSC